MDHARIDQEQILERYLMGKLEGDELRHFEEHFVDCPSCLERLQATESLKLALKEMPEDEVAVRPRSSRSTIARRLLQGLLAAGLLLAILSSWFFSRDASRARRELAIARQDTRLARQEQAKLEKILERERAVASSAPTTPIAATVFMLNITRGASPEPENRILLAEKEGWVSLVFDPPDRLGISSYRARISTADGRTLAEAVVGGGPTEGMLAVSLPSSLLSDGDYVLAVDGFDGAGRIPLATYRLRIQFKK